MFHQYERAPVCLKGLRRLKTQTLVFQNNNASKINENIELNRIRNAVIIRDLRKKTYFECFVVRVGA